MHEVALADLGLYEGGYLLLKRALKQAPEIRVTGSTPELDIHLGVWCRAEGHAYRWHGGYAVIGRGPAESSRWSGAERAGNSSPVEHPPRTWGLAARGALVEAGAPEFDFRLVDKLEVWSDDAARIYAQAVAAQWDPATAIPWNAPFDLPEEIEDAVVQIMTYLIENEMAALIIPSRFLAQLHPQFREVMQVLAVQAADEARHVEVFTRRAGLRRQWLGLSTAGGQSSLKTLVEEQDFAIASFLLSVLGEGTFLSLLKFIEHHAPDPVTAAVAQRAAQDEARHVAFGLAHLRQHVERDPHLRVRLADSVKRRHAALRDTAGLNGEVFDALLLLAAGSWSPADLRRGHESMQALLRDMHEGRQMRLERLGFNSAEAAGLSSLHTRNFM
jgi:hypothetical protein